MKNFTLLSLVCALLAVPCAAHADAVYTSQSTFLAATSGLATVTFDGLATPGSFVGEGDSFALNGATFSIPATNYLNVTDAAYYPGQPGGSGLATYDDGGYLVANGSAADNLLTITFAPSTAVSFSYGGIFGPGSFPVTLSDGTTLILSTGDSITGTGTLAFIGFTSTTPITSITLDIPNSGNNGAIDNVAFGAATTPEPSSFALLLTGLAAGAGAVRRRLVRNQL